MGLAAQGSLELRVDRERRIKIGFRLVELPHCMKSRPRWASPAATFAGAAAIAALKRRQRQIEIAQIHADQPLAEQGRQLARIEATAHDRNSGRPPRCD